MRSKLRLPAGKIAEASELAGAIASPVHSYIEAHTTVTVERATLRALGADGVDSLGVPVPNLAVASLAASGELGGGAAGRYVSALLTRGLAQDELDQAIAGGLDIFDAPEVDPAAVEAKARELVEEFGRRVAGNVAQRNARLAEFGESERSPILYVIVATGNIYEDVKQAVAAAEQGAGAVAVIRSTAQSLLDYVPHGATTEGFGGTYATQENFRIMREALDAAGENAGRYVRLVNYCSGLCMPEIAVMGALERLDMMLND